jgi:hypothetical protein
VLKQYELFFMDASYGSENGGIGMVEKHLMEYLDYNMNPESDLRLFGESTLLGLRCPYLEIEAASFASDENGLGAYAEHRARVDLDYAKPGEKVFIDMGGE